MAIADETPARVAGGEPFIMKTDRVRADGRGAPRRVTYQLTPVALPPIEAIARGGARELRGPELRHGRQRFADVERSLAGGELRPLHAANFPHHSGGPSFALGERYRYFAITPAIEGQVTVYLFNVIVAFEWEPSDETIRELLYGLRGASDVLYDATNGGMAFGQVTFGGPELMQRADIQIMASNRFHPRSMVGGLLEEQKFSPIRLGRGLWRKSDHTLLPWSDTIAYRAIAHEWAHYALSLRDEYIDDALTVRRRPDSHLLEPGGATPVVVPRISLSVETLMETLESDELVPLRRADPGDEAARARVERRILNQVEEWYPLVAGRLREPNPGPSRFPGALPRYFAVPGFRAGAPGEVAWRADGLGLDHCWLYTLHADGAGRHLVAQGTLDADAASPTAEAGDLALPGAPQRLLGVRGGETLVAIGLGPERGGRREVAVRHASVPTPDDAARPAPLAWQPRTLAGYPVVSVIPVEGGVDWGSPLRVKVRVVGAVPSDVWLAEPGPTPMVRLAGPAGELYTSPGGGYQEIAGLDGSVALELGAGPERTLWVSEYSHGGNPPTTVRKAGAPISAGSSDGNLMIFSRLDDEDAPPVPDHYQNAIITTRNYAGFEERNPGTPASYLFSVAANRRLDPMYRPTIVLYFDAEALDDDGELILFRFDEGIGDWVPVPAYMPEGQLYAAAPVTDETAPSLAAASPGAGLRLEHYRLFRVPRSLARPEAL